ncbi:MAG TPA: nucleotide sugar dehydrogenase, partial [Candidatus Sulfotelmatobacter sp.]|nr:nucleotide sugar dehydrogenase [Candidatus Sulfotelmatobacter sp.]
SDVSFISVGTPSERSGAPALGALDAVAEEIGRAIGRKSTPHTVVVRSTVPPGTVEQRVAPILVQSSGRTLGAGLELCSNPEFLREGSAIRDFGQPPFTLVGSTGEQGFAVMQEVYRDVKAPLIRTSVQTAESIKYLCNIFHAVKIGFANEIGSVLKPLGVDAREAMRIFCEDRILNISSAYLRPGFAFGGSCLPKDLRGFLSIAQAQGVDLPFLGNLLASNQQHVERAFQMIARGGRRKVALFGLAFKPGTDDLRESPLVTLAERLIGKGFDLAIYDRHVEVARLVGSNREFIDREIPHLERLLRPTPEATLDGAGVIVIGHAAAAEVAAVAAAHAGRSIVDLQGVKDLERLQGADYQGICW